MISTIMAQTAMILCRKLEFKENCSAGRVVSVGFWTREEHSNLGEDSLLHNWPLVCGPGFNISYREKIVIERFLLLFIPSPKQLF